MRRRRRKAPLPSFIHPDHILCKEHRHVLLFRGAMVRAPTHDAQWERMKGQPVRQPTLIKVLCRSESTTNMFKTACQLGRFHCEAAWQHSFSFPVSGRGEGRQLRADSVYLLDKVFHVWTFAAALRLCSQSAPSMGHYGEQLRVCESPDDCGNASSTSALGLSAVRHEIGAPKKVSDGPGGSLRERIKRVASQRRGDWYDCSIGRSSTCLDKDVRR